VTLDACEDASPSIPTRNLMRRVARFQAPVLHRSLAQILTSIGGLLATSAAMYATAGLSYWIVLALAPLAAGFLVRTFIIQHDCGHGAFFRSRRWNDALGFACSMFTLAPYLSWRRQHAGHHSVWNNLDRRDTGADIYSSCLTVAEYRALGPGRRRWYRWTRHPLVANLIIPPLVFLVLYRLPFDMPAGWRRERIGVYLTNLALGALIGGIGLALGFGRVAEVQLPVMVLASVIGVWLFTVQHRSERTVWARQGEWNVLTASLRGSTYLRLGAVLQWFTGNIGLHHVHHLNPRIPNYRLQPCHESLAELREVPVMTFGAALKAMFFVLWDEGRQRMVTFRAAAAA
jgi:acyl-lipid omega-6 desaturase (Delta-12 desaturase)